MAPAFRKVRPASEPRCDLDGVVRQWRRLLLLLFRGAAATGRAGGRTFRDARRPPRRWSTASCNCKRKSANGNAVALTAPGGRRRWIWLSKIWRIRPPRFPTARAPAGGTANSHHDSRDAISGSEISARRRQLPIQADDVCGVDWPGREPRFDVVYNLLSPFTTRASGQAETDDGAGSFRRRLFQRRWWSEAWDMYGIPFAGHLTCAAS